MTLLVNMFQYIQSTENEILQILCFGELQHSDILDHLPNYSSQEEGFSRIDDILDAIAIFRAPDEQRNGTYMLNKELWESYDSFYYLIFANVSTVEKLILDSLTNIFPC